MGEALPHSMNTSKWGPAAWTFIHATCYNYPDTPTEEQSQNMLTFLTSLGTIMPCKYCRASFKAFLTHMPLTPHVLSSHSTLNHWVWELHNKVNQKLGKPIVPFDTLVRNMERIKAK